ncbi:MAG: isocitrate dehydrogenase (NADP(+)) [Desulfatibacillaceae bacterium]
MSEQEQIITINSDGSLSVPDNPVLCFIEGDGTGPDIWRATRRVLEAGVEHAYKGAKRISWREILAGEKAYNETGEWLPEATLEDIKKYAVAIKGPLTTPVGQGIRSVNVAIRQRLDLYACVRPVHHVQRVPSPVKHPDRINMVVFRENTEDLYAGIEWRAGEPETEKLIAYLRDTMGASVAKGSAIGIKPMSAKNTKRLVRMAVQYAVDHGRPTVTLMHKGNIMKFTEGAFATWGYEAAREYFPGLTITEQELWDDHGGKAPEGKIVIRDRIADNLFQQVLLRPDEFDVIATPNLNGDYISDALAAQVGGLGLAPGANIGDGCAVFEATHGTAPKYAGLDKVNPSSLILSGCMMLNHIGWAEAAEAVEEALSETVGSGVVTYDLARQMEGAREVKCSEFGEAIVQRLGA